MSVISITTIIIIALAAIVISIILKYPNPELDTALIEDLAYNYSETKTRRSNRAATTKPPLQDVTIVITGSTSGIGKGLSCTLYKLGATIVAVGRSTTKLTMLEQELMTNCTSTSTAKNKEKKKRIITILSDFSDLESVSKASDKILSSKNIKSLDFLINNAGFGYNEPLESYVTKQGYDLCFGVNYLSHFLLTEKLLPLLQKSKYINPRIIQISSSFHWQVDERELIPYTSNGENIIDPIASRNEKGITLSRAYANSKLAQILHGRALSRKLSDKNKIEIISTCPGWVRTNILNDNIGQIFLKTFGFPSNGFGLSSTLNAMFRTNDIGSYNHDNFITNWDMNFLLNFVPLSKWANTLWIRDGIIMFIAITILPAAQKFMFHEYGSSKSSPESYNSTAQDALYDWSYDAVSKWL